MKKINWQGDKCPNNYMIRDNGGMKQLILFVDVEQNTETNTWSAIEIIMPIGEFDYGSIVSAIINSHYSNDQMQAIINNYLIGKSMEKFEAMQTYRTHAKKLARTILDEISS